MTIFRNFKNNQRVANHSKIKSLRYFGLRSSALEQKMEKRRIRKTMKVLDEVKVQFPETAKFIDECTSV